MLYGRYDAIVSQYGPQRFVEIKRGSGAIPNQLFAVQLRGVYLASPCKTVSARHGQPNGFPFNQYEAVVRMVVRFRSPQQGHIQFF